MANRDMIDIFDECIDRLAAGEDIETILLDYPADAESLRGLLETGLLVYQVQNETPGVDEARSRGRGKLEEAMSEMEIETEKPKRGRRPIQWIVFTSAAVFALMLGIGIGIGNSMGRPEVLPAIAMVLTSTAQANDGNMMQTATQIIVEVTGSAEAYNRPLEGTPLPPTMVAPDDNGKLTATQMVAEITGTAERNVGDGRNTGTPLPTGTFTPTMTVTATTTPMPTNVLGPLPTSVGSFDSMTATPISGAVSEVAASSGGDSGGVALTATALRMSLGTTVPGGDGDGGFAGGPAGTMLPGTPTAEAVLLLPTPTSMASMPGMPDVVMTSTASYIAVTDVADREDDKDELAEPLSPPVVTTGDTTTSIAVAPTTVPDFSQIQLQPLKAGEIDDNADWDTYTLYRRNFLEMYGGLVLDVDITGRQIIKVIDPAGRPVLGATVEVLYGTQPVSKTLTYATGMTLFFPNAKPEFRRIDTFRVVVTKDGHTTETTLNIERIDDILTITLN